MPDIFGAVDFLKEAAEPALRRFVRTHRGASYAEMRFEAMFSRAAVANDGAPRESDENEAAAFGVMVWYAGAEGVAGHGQTGVEVGRLALSQTKLLAALKECLGDAFERAKANARERAGVLNTLVANQLGALSLMQPSTARDHVEAIFARDPRTLTSAEVMNLCQQGSAAVSALGKEVAYNAVAATAELRHELFLNTAGALISQRLAFAQGDCYVVAQSSGGHQEIYDTIGQQRGFEALAEGWPDELMPNPDLPTFALQLAGEARQLAQAPVLPAPDREVVVVTDPHFNALVAHEIVGHPCEADRALKMEAAYAG
ncbi:MAG: hypothetical protein JOY71_02065, partial [Acetobacteraceae bacterium]|nr:hypothetical protein [Acetobacteraceae bacterium]